LLISRPCLLGLSEIHREIRADELRAGAPGHSFRGGVQIIDLAVIPDGHQRVESGLEQASIVGTRQSGLAPAGLRLGSMLLCPGGKMPRSQRRYKDSRERYPVLGVFDCERVNRWQEEVVQAQH